MAGLAAAVEAQRRGARVVLHEAASHAGGRCRSFFDSKLGVTLDNGNHLLLSGNQSTMAYLRAIGAAESLIGPTQPEYPFFDVTSGDAWTIRMSSGRLPRWIFDADARVPGTQPADYLPILPLFFAKPGRTIDESVRRKDRVWNLLVRPLLRAMLNADPSEASAELAAGLLRETVAQGGQACRPLVARSGLSHAFVEPALRLLQYGGADIRFGSRVAGIGISGTDSRERVSSLAFEGAAEPVVLGADDAVVLAVPPDAARRVVPDLSAPQASRAIVTVHFAADAPAGMSDWIFAADGRLSVTLADSGRWLSTPHEELARLTWLETAKAVRMPAVPTPPWRVVVEEHATFAAVPAQEGSRPATRTRWHNFTLAGDWTATGLPATIEGAIRSGQKAVDALLNPSMER